MVKEWVDAYKNDPPEEIDEDFIPNAGILPAGTFFTHSSPVSLMSCVYKHLKIKGVTAESNLWEMDFALPGDILNEKFPGTNKPKVEDIKVEFKIFTVPTEEKQRAMYYANFTFISGNNFVYRKWLKNCDKDFLG